MPYMSSERRAEIRNKIKAALPEYKFSITNEHHSGIRIHILAGPIQMLTSPKTIEKGHESVNHFYIDEHYNENPEVKAVLLKIMEIANEGNGTESIDGDYGNIPHFYIHIAIGDWDKRYQVIEKKSVDQSRPPIPAPTGDKIATCKINKAKGGIELYFPGKPAASVLDDLKANGFRWSKFNKCWYKLDNAIARKVAAKYADIPQSLNATERIKDAQLVDAQEQAAIANGNY